MYEMRTISTINEVISATGIPSRLVRGVIRQLGGMEQAKQAMADILNHGVNQSCAGFINHERFFETYRTEIVQHINALAKTQRGGDAASMILRWPAMTAKGLNAAEKLELRDSIIRCLSGSRITTDTDKRTARELSWCAFELVARCFYY